MTRDEAIEILKGAIKKPNTKDGYMGQALTMAIKALEQQTCEDAVSREAVLGLFAQNADAVRPYSKTWEEVKALPSVNPQQKTGYYKDCRYFEYDSVANVDGIPLIVAHEICSKWGNGCKTKEDGYCFLFELKKG